MDYDFLVGPVMLGPQRQMMWVLEVFEGVLDPRLSMVGFYDFFAAPLVPVGHQYPQSELVLELVQLVVVEGKIQLESAGAFLR